MRSLKPLSYVDAHGALITIPPGEVERFVGVKHELLGAITRLLCAVGEGDIELDDKDHGIFRWTLNAMVHEVGELVPVMKADLNQMKGGAR